MSECHQSCQPDLQNGHQFHRVCSQWYQSTRKQQHRPRIDHSDPPQKTCRVKRTIVNRNEQNAGKSSWFFQKGD